MSVASDIEHPAAKKRVIYVLMVVTGILFVSTLALPFEESTAEFVAPLAFGVMSGLWLGHLLYSL